MYDKIEEHLKNEIYFRQDSELSKNIKKFFICSWGGCGSTILQTYLINFGLTYHIHDSNPPINLKYAGKNITEEMEPWCYKEWSYINDNKYYEHFSDIDIPNDDIENCYVIFIYRNPIYSIYSRFINPEHLKHIGCNSNITINNIIETKEDLYNIKKFFNEYKYKKKNYKTIFVKYEDLFDNFDKLNNLLGIPSIPNLYPIKIENVKKMDNYKELENIYLDLILEMKEMNSIEII